MQLSYLITGAAGFIGSNVALFLDKKNEIYGLDLQKPEELVLKSVKKYIKIKLPDSQFETFIKKIKPEVIIHCAGAALISHSVQFPEDDFLKNVIITQYILDSIRNNSPSTKFILISSAAVYGNPNNLPVNETHPHQPISPYGFHKSIAENLCMEYSKLYNLETRIVRIFSAYGTGLKKQLFWDIYQKINNSKNNIIELFGTGTESRDFVYITDIVKAILTIILHSKINADVFNIASGIECNIETAAKTFTEIINPKVKIIFNKKDKCGDPQNWCADITKLKSLGFEPRISLKDGLIKYAQWLKENA